MSQQHILNERKGVVEEASHLVAFRGGMVPELTIGLQRVGHTIVVYRQDLYLYGGYGPKNVYSNEIFCNRKMTLQWKEIRGLGVVPSGRANHTAVIHENKMIVYGGHRNLEVFDDLYILNIETTRWERVNYERAQGPGPLFSHVSVYVPPTQTMVVIGGFHQRKHNMYVAHSFDIRHRIWNGIRGPESINLLHVQMCAAVYNHASTSIIVVGMVEEEILSATSCESPTVYMMNVHSGLWVEVSTLVSPDSPIPFRMAGVWECFMRDFITMGDVYDEKRQEWYFPILLGPIENFLVKSKSEKRASISTVDSKLSVVSGPPQCGFFKLHIVDMKWSIVPVKFPKRVINELMARRISRIPRPKDRPGAVSRSKGKKKTEKKNVLNFLSLRGVSRFQRKYAYAVLDASAMRGPRSCDKLLIIHGGLDTEDYVMLMFTPIFKKRFISPASHPLDPFVAFNEEGTSAYSMSTRGGSNDHLSFALEDSLTESENDFTRLTAGVPQGEVVSESMGEEDVNLAVGRLHRLNSDPTLLPLMPSTRNAKNKNRFALLYHPRNAIRSEKFLPDLTCPVAVMEKDSQIRSWAENLYLETRQWIATTVGVVAEEERKAWKNRRRGRRHRRMTMYDEQDEESSSDDGSVSIDSTDAKTVGTKLPEARPPTPPRPIDFFMEKDLEVFNLGSRTVRRMSYYTNTPFLLPDETPDSMDRLRVSVKRFQEVQRLPSAVFQRSSLGNITDVSGAMAYLLMESALARCEENSQASRRKRALIRWRYLRVMVLIGEASFIVHRATQEEGKGYGVKVSSTSQLILAPDLQLSGVGRNKVPTRPVPYAVPSFPAHGARTGEITARGLVMYHFTSNVN